jgi:hypothetical protein
MNGTSKLHSFYPPLKKEIKINQFEIKVVELVLFKYVRIAVCLHDSEGKPIDWRYYVLDGTDYSNYGTDDTYVVNYVKRRLREEHETFVVANAVEVFKKGMTDSISKPKSNLSKIHELKEKFEPKKDIAEQVVSENVVFTYVEPVVNDTENLQQECYDNSNNNLAVNAELGSQ